MDQPGAVPTDAAAAAPVAPPRPRGGPKRPELIDLDCDCLDDVKASRCWAPFLNAATCHNRVLKIAMHRRREPELFQCVGLFMKFEECREKYGVAMPEPKPPAE